MCEDERGSPPVMPYVIACKIHTKPIPKSVVAEYKGERAYCVVNKNGEFMFDMANFKDWNPEESEDTFDISFGVDDIFNNRKINYSKDLGGQRIDIKEETQ